MYTFSEFTNTVLIGLFDKVKGITVVIMGL